MTWVLTKGLATVRDEFNAVFPHRDKASDGAIGNTAHQAERSGHNPDITGNSEYRDGDSKDEVRAIDIDADLRSTVTMEQVVQYLIRQARRGVYIPFRYVIYNRRIWSRRDGWAQHAYDGDPHTSHVHLSGDYTQTADEWTGTLGLAKLLQEDDMPLTDADAKLIGAHHETFGSDIGEQSYNTIWALGYLNAKRANDGVAALAAEVETIKAAVTAPATQPPGAGPTAAEVAAELIRQLKP
jgi:hypothetical protein